MNDDRPPGPDGPDAASGPDPSPDGPDAAPGPGDLPYPLAEDLEADEEEFLAAWDEVDRECAELLSRACPQILSEAAPATWASAARRLRRGVEAHEPWYDYFRFGCDWQQQMPEDDTDLWLQAAAATFEPPEDPGTDEDAQTAVATLQHADQLGMVLGLVRRGVGARFDADHVARDIEESPEIEVQPDVWDRAGPEEEYLLPVAVLANLWEPLGILDADSRLTEVGRWGLPRAMLRVWNAEDPTGPAQRGDDGAAGEGAAPHAPQAGAGDQQVGVELLEEPQAQQALDLLVEAGPMPLEDLRRALARQSVFTDQQTLMTTLDRRAAAFELADQAWCHLPTLLDGLVLTHELTPPEADAGALVVDGDLDVWTWLADDGIELAGGGELRTSWSDPQVAAEPPELTGPDHWLDPCPVGHLVVLRLDHGVATVEFADPDQVQARPPDLLADRAREAARAALEEFHAGESHAPGAPLDDVVCGVRRSDPDALTEPAPPLTRLLEEAGLEVVEGHVGVHNAPWEGEPEQLSDAQRQAYRRWLEVLRCHRADASLPEPDELASLAGTLDEDLLGELGSRIAPDPTAVPLLRAVQDAVSGPRRGGPLYLQARVAEHAGRPREALDLAERAHDADPGLGTVAAVLADLRSAAGDAEGAFRAYQLAGTGQQHPVIRLLPRFRQRAEGEVGRNRPCPCGSGKKYKVCHGRDVAHPLSERADWLWAKVVAFAREADQVKSAFWYAELLAGSDADFRTVVMAALTDPLCQDMAVFDGGMLADFLRRRGALLPADEQTLAEEWLRWPRRLLEVTEVLALRGMRCRDLLTGEEVELRDRTMSREAQRLDLLFCRPLPDAAGGLRVRDNVRAVPRTQRTELLALLREDAPAEQVAQVFAARSQPPELVTTEDEESGESALSPPEAGPDPDTERQVLDEAMRRHEETWPDQSLPALGGLTPRQAATDPQWRPELQALLDDFAWQQRHHPEQPQMDLDRVRRELGLAPG